MFIYPNEGTHSRQEGVRSQETRSNAKVGCGDPTDDREGGVQAGWALGVENSQCDSRPDLAGKTNGLIENLLCMSLFRGDGDDWGNGVNLC